MTTAAPEQFEALLALRLPPTAHFLRPQTFDRTGEEAMPEWLVALPSQPTVYMTLGTVFNTRIDLFATVIMALRDEPANLILTVRNLSSPVRQLVMRI